MSNKATVIMEAANHLINNSKEEAINIINSKYKFSYIEREGRKYTDDQKFNMYLRDGFIDRYTGDKLVIPGMLKVLSVYYPEEFPYHPHWKMDRTHIAYWELVPTIDHVVPIALGGRDSEDNWVTTSMLHNSIKSNWTLEQIGWKVVEPGDIKEWDGLTRMFIEIVERDEELLKDNYIRKWYRLAKRNITIE